MDRFGFVPRSFDESRFDDSDGALGFDRVPF
jgi:hypothetical protein